METSGNVLVLSGLINPDYHPNLKFIRRKRGEGGVIVRWRNVEGMVGNTEDMLCCGCDVVNANIPGPRVMEYVKKLSREISSALFIAFLG